MIIRLAFPLLFFLVFSGCKQGPKINEEIARMDLKMEINRFDLDFSMASPEDLPRLKKNYPFLFPSQYPDTVWTNKMKDSLQGQLEEEVVGVFDKFESQKEDLLLLMKHIKFYYPKTKVPRVITLISDVDYNNRVVLADSLLLIGLDNYLGADHRFYSGIDRYIARNLDKKYLNSDIASAFANRLVRIPRDRSYLEAMIYYGKLLYLKDLWMPLASDSEKIHYSDEELQWAENNEEQIWRYFVDRELLFSTDQELWPRFLDPAPFSKFRLELDSESPGRIGRYIGWMIVRSFMENNEIPLNNMIGLSGEEIFNNAKYKPKR